MSDVITQEFQHRLELWLKLQKLGGERAVAPQIVRELGIYGGAQGVWVDKDRTEKLTSDGTGIAIGLLHTGDSYPDDLSADGLLYHYPNTRRSPGRDRSEIDAVKAASRLGLPIFVITHSEQKSSKRDIHFGWVESWDDRSALFLISFGESRPFKAIDEEEHRPFELTTNTPKKSAEVAVRQGQQRFKFAVLKRYGPECAVCGINLLDVLDAAHLCPKGKCGSDDPRNGLVLCASHHRAFDAGLFGIHPDTMEICFRPEGPSAEELHIKSRSLSHLTLGPHRDAVAWLWNRWLRKDRETSASSISSPKTINEDPKSVSPVDQETPGLSMTDSESSSRQNI